MIRAINEQFLSRFKNQNISHSMERKQYAVIIFVVHLAAQEKVETTFQCQNKEIVQPELCEKVCFKLIYRVTQNFTPQMGDSI